MLDSDFTRICIQLIKSININFSFRSPTAPKVSSPSRTWMPSFSQTRRVTLTACRSHTNMAIAPGTSLFIMRVLRCIVMHSDWQVLIYEESHSLFFTLGNSHMVQRHPCCSLRVLEVSVPNRKRWRSECWTDSEQHQLFHLIQEQQHESFDISLPADPKDN